MSGGTAPELYFPFADAERFDELVGLFAADATLIGPGSRPRQGHAEIRQYYERAFAPYREHEDRPTRFIDAGDTVVVEIRFSGVHESGTELTFDAVDVFDLDSDGKIARFSSWYDSYWVRSRLGL